MRLTYLAILILLSHTAYAIDPKDMARTSILIEGAESVVSTMTSYCSKIEQTVTVEKELKLWEKRNKKYLFANKTYIESIEKLQIFKEAREKTVRDIQARSEMFKTKFFLNQPSKETGCNVFLSNLSGKRFDFTNQKGNKSFFLNEFVKEINKTFNGA